MFEGFVAKKLIGALVLPPTGPLLVAMLGLLMLNWRPRAGRALAWVGVTALFLFSLPIVEGGLSWLLYRDGPVDMRRAQEAQALVILGGGVRREALEYGGDTLGRLTLDRVRYGAWIARQTGLPVLVTGGSTRGSTSEASVMARALEDEFGIVARWRETESRNTHENAQFSAAILKRSGIDRILLVSHGFDVPRARAEFEAAGLQVIPAPTYISVVSVESLFDFVPNITSLYGSHYACYELLANLALALGI